MFHHHRADPEFSSVKMNGCIFSEFPLLETTVGNQAHYIPQVGLVYMIHRERC